MATPFRLPRLPRGVPIVDSGGLPTKAFQQWWQSVVTKIEAQEAAQDDLLAAIIAAQDAADTANAAAAAADASAAAAQDAADATTAQTNLVNSYPDPPTGLLTGIDAGADAKITVASHTRVYGDGTTVAITGADITGLAYSTFGYVYYIDATRADTTPTFLFTTDQTIAAQTGDTHLIGSVTTPAVAAPPNDGDYVLPPGVGNIP